MTDPKDQPKKDEVQQSACEPTGLKDEQLEDVAGGIPAPGDQPRVVTRKFTAE